MLSSFVASNDHLIAGERFCGPGCLWGLSCWTCDSKEIAKNTAKKVDVLLRPGRPFTDLETDRTLQKTYTAQGACIEAMTKNAWKANLSDLHTCKGKKNDANNIQPSNCMPQPFNE